MRKILTVAYTIYLIICVTVDDAESGCESYNPMRDNATLDYLILEEDLWGNLSMGVNQDENSLSAFVWNAHRQFLQHFGFVSNSDELFKLPSTENLKDALIQVWRMRLDINYKLSSEYSPQYSAFSDETLNQAKNVSGVITHEMTRPEFWTDGTDYLDECKGVEYDPSKISPYSTIIEAPYQKILDYYHQGRGALLHNYILAQLSLMLKSISARAPYTTYRPKSSTLLKDQFKNGIKLIHQTVSNALKNASREIWNCRRNKYASGCVACSRFQSLMNFLDGYIDNEINLNEEGTCARSCSDYTKTKHFQCAERTICANPNPQRDPNGLVPRETICDGIIRDCRDIGVDGDIVVNFGKFTAGRYNYIVFNDGNEKRTYGLDPKEVWGLNVTAPVWNRLSNKCSNCFCSCDTETKSDRYFSLHDVVSNIRENKVVYGVQIFISHNGIVQLKIKEGKLTTRGQVSYGDSVKSVYQFEGYDKPVVGVDYFRMTYENRSINLDDVVVPQGKTVTGVRFAHRDGHVFIEVRATDIDYAEGRLKNVENSVWISNSNGGKREFLPPNRLNPFEKHNQGKIYVPQHTTDSYVRFVPSDFQTDLSQLMVPLIETDFYGISSGCPTALSGIGLTYVNDEECTTAGAVIPKLIVYKFPLPSLDDLLD